MNFDDDGGDDDDEGEGGPSAAAGLLRFLPWRRIDWRINS